MSPLHDLITTTVVAGLLAGHVPSAIYIWHTRRALRAARRIAEHDETTGLPNRRALQARFGRHTRHGSRVAVAMLDLDTFKTVNDSHGHAAGDAVLQQVASRLAALPHPVLCAARLSGDEFALLIDDTSGDAVPATHAAWQAINATPVTVLDGTTLQVSASAGVAIGRLGAELSQLLHEADLAMYAAKTSNGGIRVYTTDLTTPTGSRERPAVRVRDRRRAPTAAATRPGIDTDPTTHRRSRPASSPDDDVPSG